MHKNLRHETSRKKIRVLIVCILRKKWPQKGRQMFETTYYRTVFCINDEKYLGKDGLYVIKDNVLQKESSLSWKEERCIQAPSLKSSPPLWWSFFQVSFAQKMDDLSSTKIPASSHAPRAKIGFRMLVDHLENARNVCRSIDRNRAIRKDGRTQRCWDNHLEWMPTVY